MSSFGQVEDRLVWDMLNACAPGHTIKEYTHTYCVMYNGKTYPRLPKKRQIDVGHIKKMCRHPGILDCAKKHLGI
jgi:hypothetical protein